MQFPVEEVIPQIRDALERNRSVVLKAPPGSGKTTCVPPALLDARFLAGKKILMLEPRRLAARSSAEYISSKLGERCGGIVGYQVRLERKISSGTRLEIVTEGLLTQRLLSDPELSDVGLIVFDEFHERSLQCDLGFAMALDVRRALRDDLRILVMSATLDVDEIAQHLGDAEIVQASGRMYPVEMRYLREETTAPIAAVMAGAVKRACDATEGDILCFLPGEGEIRRCADELRAMDINGARVMPLYGALPKGEQDMVFARCDRRKVILATSIAETSVTIDGITVVIDCGLMRVPKFSASSGMGRLETLRITRDRADQRAGRAGRTRAGVCYRLWTEAQDKLLKPKMRPEILDADLAPVLLACAACGTVKIDGVPWLTEPPSASWNNALQLLKMLGALDGDGRLTKLGKGMSGFGVHPRLAAMMMRMPCERSCLIAAVLEEISNGGPRREVCLDKIIDFVSEVPNDRFSRRVRELAARWFGKLRSSSGRPESGCGIGETVSLAFPDRIAKNRGNSTFVMTCGRGAFVERTEAIANCDYLVICEQNDAGGDAKVHLASPIFEEAIEDMFADRIAEKTLTEWDAKTESVKAIRARVLGKMALSVGGQARPDEYEIQKALFEGIRKKGVDQLGWEKSSRQLQSRIQFLHRVMDGADWPDVSDAAIEADLDGFLGGFSLGITRWSQIGKIDLFAVLDAALASSGHDRRELDKLAPQKMDVPSGSSITIHYEETEPFAAVRLQETFGLMETPRVAGGRVPIVMHLLSPAQRPIQITKDLAGFWAGAYQLVRKDLRGRYPKHYWPEDPFTAVATRRVRPQNSK